jgi:hypothetical protein
VLALALPLSREIKRINQPKGAVMKILYSLILVVLYSVVVFSTSSNAQAGKVVKEESLAKRAFSIIPSSLNSNIPGIVESTIYNTVVVKKYYPMGNYDNIIDKLNDIAEGSKDPSIRFKAHLASIYLSFSDIINVEPQHHTFDHEYIFRQIADQLESKLLVSK